LKHEDVPFSQAFKAGKRAGWDSALDKVLIEFKLSDRGYEELEKTFISLNDLKNRIIDLIGEDPEEKE